MLVLFAGLTLCFPSRTEAQVVINEVHFNPIGGSANEFVELFNSGTSAVTISNWRFTDGITHLFPAPTTLAPGSYLVVAADRAAFLARYPAVTNLAAGAYAGQLNNQGERLTLVDAATNVVFAVTYDDAEPWPAAAAGLGSSLVLLDPFASPANSANWGASAEVHGSPGGPGALFLRDIVIHEVMTHADPPLEDAVEVINVSTAAVDLAGWFLSDDADVRKKYRFPTNSLVPPQGYRVVYQAQLTNSVDALIPFALNAKGDDVYLTQGNTNGDLVRFVDAVSFDAARNGVSFGRYPNAKADLLPLAFPTFGVSAPVSVEAFRTGTGAPNASPWVGPVVIHEIMYHPSTSQVPPRMDAEFIELLNTSTSAVPLYITDYPELTWSLTGGISYSFPTNLTLPAGAFLLIVSTNDPAGFRASYGVPASVPILGPWSNALNNAGDTVRLRVPNTPEGVSNTVGRYVMDEVTYNDKLPWPLAADGLGGSLERIDASTYGDTPENWHSAPNVSTPGRTNTSYVPPGSIVISEVMAANRHTLQDEDGDYSDWIELYNTRPYGISLAGWHLTDQSAMPTQWTFPPITIRANASLLVFASQKNRTNALARLHTNFALDEAGEFLALFRPDLVREFAFDPAYPPQSADISYGFGQFGSHQEIPLPVGSVGRYRVPTNAEALATNWMNRTFDDTGWSVAVNGIGYDTEPTYTALIATDLRAEMYNKRSSVFARFPFVVSNSTDVALLTLRLKYDDGLIAWLNGAEVASANAPAGGAWNAAANASRSDALAVVYQDFDLSAQRFRLLDGTNMLAFQLLNQSSNSSDLLLVSELQLERNGSATGTAGFVLGHLQPATPGGFNGVALPGVAPLPELSHPGGVFSGLLAVTIACARAEAELRYTLNGSAPAAGSPLYTAPLVFSNDTELLVRAFLPGLVPSPAIGAVYRKAFLGINEVLVDNATATPEIADFTDFGDWVELYNAGTASVALDGYHLSDNLDQPFRWRIPDGAVIPAGGYLLIWADGFNSYPGRSLNRPFWPYAAFTTRYYHSNFKLASEGESVGLFSPSGSLVDAVTFGPQAVDISYGRFPDGAAAWGYFGEPTAGTNNLTPALAHNLYRAPAVTIAPTNDALIVTGALQVVLASDPGVTAIRFTTNGAIPTSSSLVYTQAFTLATSAVVRARAYMPDRHPGPIATRTFLRNVRAPELPLIALAIDPRLLFDPVVGIYANLLKEREVPGNLQFCTTPTNTGFQVDAGFRIYGLNTFLFAQKPFTMFLDSKYGQDVLAYHLFPEKPIGAFDRFILRNGNDDWPLAFLRDTLGQRMLRGAIGNAIQSFRPCAIYLNGAYYGLINIQEKMDEMYCASNYGVPLEDIDFFESDGFSSAALLNAGTQEGWDSLLAFLSANSLANATNYAYVKSQVDIEDLVDYVAAQTFVVDTSWSHNRKWWRDRKPGGKWRWCFVDLDRGLTPANVNNNLFNSMASSMVVFRECLANTEFRAYCAQRVMAHMNSSFGTNRTLPIINAEALHIRSEIDQHARLYSTRGGIPSVATWDTRVEEIRGYARQRPAIAMQQVANYFTAGATAKMRVDVSGGSGSVLANHVVLAPGETNTFAAGLPLLFTALPDIGQTFVRWEVASNAPVTLVAAGSTWKYLDTVTNAVPGWADPAYNDAAWPSGPGQLGYGDGDEATTISYGPDANNKRITTYFRGVVNLPDPGVYTSIVMGLLRDDGVVAYVNGREVLRNNLPAGPIGINTLALANITFGAENIYNVFTLAPSNFTAGANTLAFEIHNFTNNNPDLGFDLRLTALGLIQAVTLTNGPDLSWTPSGSESVRAVFAPAGVSLLPAVIASNTALVAAQSPYYATGDIFVPSNTTLLAGPGVEIQMPESADIRVQGQLRLLGTTNAPVRVLANTNANATAHPYMAPTGIPDRRWGGLSFDQATHTGELVQVVIRGATLTKSDPVNHKAAVSALRSDLWIDGLDLDEVQFPIFVQEGNSTVLQNSRVHLAITGDGINIKRTAYARVENCDFTGALAVDADAIDYDGVHGGIIRGNRLRDFMGPNNDAMDIGEGATDLLIESNIVSRIADKAVSIGQGSTAIVRRNQIRDCDLGVGIKDAGSYGLVEYNTFHKSGNGVAIYEKSRGNGGGSADIRGCIFSEGVRDPITVDALSTARVSYCLSDTLPLAVPGAGNVNAQPQFENAARMNFRLQTGSAAVNAGPPGDAADADGSRADMGAVAFDWREGHVVFSEIHYHPGDSNATEFVELSNPGGAAMDLSGFRINKGFAYTFPPGTTLQAGGYLVLAASTNGLAGVSNLLIWTSGVLDNTGETLELQDAASNELDRLTYASFDPWPAPPDGLGPSLSLISPRFDNALPASWYASGAVGGTPGAPFNQYVRSPLTIDQAAAGAMSIGFDGFPGLEYLLEHSPALIPSDWQPLRQAVPGPDGRLSFEFTPEPGWPAGFYRIRLAAP